MEALTIAPLLNIDPLFLPSRPLDFVSTRVMNKPTSSPLIMSYEEFLAWTDDTTHAEWVPFNDIFGKGKVITYMPPKLIHQETINFLNKLLSLYVSQFNLGKIVLAPFEMKLGAGKSSREPDILFVAQENLARLTNDRLNGPADLVIEIVSKSTLKHDREDKFKEYRQAGIREYWIIDPRPDHQRADFYRLDAQGDYQLFATEEDERVESMVVPGFWLSPTWLWQISTLDPLLTFYQIVGLPDALVKQMQEQIHAKSGH